MSTYARFKLALRASLNELMERSARGEDVRAVVQKFNQVAADTRVQLREAREHLRELADDVRRARAEALEAETEAMAALAAGDEATARAKVYQKLESEKEAKALTAEVDAEHAQVTDLEDTLRELEDKLGPARAWAAKKTTGEVKAKTARVDETVHKAERRVDRAEAEVEADAEVDAWRELSRDLGHSDANPPKDELRDLKKKLDGEDRPKK